MRRAEYVPSGNRSCFAMIDTHRYCASRSCRCSTWVLESAGWRGERGCRKRGLWRVRDIGIGDRFWQWTAVGVRRVKDHGHLSPWGWILSLCDWYLLQHCFSGVVYLIAANAADYWRAFRLFRLCCSCS
jgi:hypothetical protein